VIDSIQVFVLVNPHPQKEEGKNKYLSLDLGHWFLQDISCNNMTLVLLAYLGGELDI
jgi:hypothetical protein